MGGALGGELLLLSSFCFLGDTDCLHHLGGEDGKEGETGVMRKSKSALEY